MFKTEREYSFREADTVFTLRAEVDEGVLGIASEYQSLSPCSLPLTCAVGVRMGPRFSPATFMLCALNKLLDLIPIFFLPLK